MGKMPGKLCFRWNGPYWLVAAENGTFTLGTLAGQNSLTKGKRVPVKAIDWGHTPYPFRKHHGPYTAKSRCREAFQVRVETGGKRWMDGVQREHLSMGNYT